MKSYAAFVPDHKDRSSLLRVFGFLELALGLFLSYVVLPFQGVWGLIFFLYAIGWGLLGFGTLRGRRWARPFTLLSSWLWPFVVIGLWENLFLKSFTLLAAFSESSAKTVAVLAPGGCGYLLFVVPLVLLPLIFLVVFSLPSVKATFEANGTRTSDRRA